MPQITNFDLDWQTETSTFITALDNKTITKLGYCCEPKGIDNSNSLKLTFSNGITNTIKIGSSGIFEYISDIDMPVTITKVEVTSNIRFTLDYSERDIDEE